jgi:hypothetical protein
MVSNLAPSRVTASRSTSNPARPASAAKNRNPKPQATVVKTWAFDSVGNRKYALQIKRAGNGNPCLKVVEGVPQPDGTYRRFELTIWSEDFPKLFETLDQVRAFMVENNIKTPDGHKFDPNRKRTFKPRRTQNGPSRNS